ncbi:MAG: secretin and TonB N-terminal domain-containing protein [Candidatus Omnitrophica bacterium]|nr:secretin and TonB N-terminal domain-containing protein [Candidatus Omnitrophota bacterium]
MLKKSGLFFLIMLALANTCPAFGVDEAPAPAASAPASAPEAAAVEPEAQVSSPGNVTIDFKDADIQNVLRILSFKSGVNIVAGKDVTGTVTMRLVDVPWEKALDVVLKTYGYAYDRDDNIIRVATLEALQKEELSTEVYTLNYASAAEVEASVKNILSERGKVRADARSNTLIVTDMPTTLQNVARVIERLDRATPQVTIHAKVIETTLGDSERMGIKWNARVGVSGSGRPSTFPFEARELLPKSIRGFFPEGRGTQTSATSVGTSSSTTSTTVADFPTADHAHSALFPVADKDEFTFGTLDFTQFQAILELIKSRSDAKILSEPRVTTLNNKEAKILVGEVIAIPTFERNSTTGRMEITGYTDRDLGIRLSVTPQINDQREIVVDIHPEISNLLGYDDLTTDIKAPRFSTREAQTQVRIRDGETIAIGGLIRENTVDTKTKFPILGDLPLLSKFFSHTDKTVQKTDLLFFMTVNIVQEKLPLPKGQAV